MLSYIYRLCRDFELEMGYPPNTLIINRDHLEHLRGSFGAGEDFASIRERLGLEMLLRQDAVHPRVNWLASAARKAG